MKIVKIFIVICFFGILLLTNYNNSFVKEVFNDGEKSFNKLQKYQTAYDNYTKSNLLTYKSNNDELKIFFHDDKKKLEINFGYGGVNSIYGIQGISYTKEEYKRLNDTNVKALKSCTDWIGPYIVKDLSKENKDIPAKFTGGWHGSNGDGTGEASAITKNLIIYCDGKLISTEDKEWSNEIKILVTNLVNAYNFAEPVLAETITYTIKNKTVYVNVKGKALKNIEITRYYGLQSQNSLWDGYVIYHYIDKSLEKFHINESSNSMKKKDNTVNELELTSKDNEYKLFVGLDNNYGLGNFQYLSESLPTCFTLSYGKSYYNLVNGKSINMNKGDVFKWRGYYKFHNKN